MKASAVSIALTAALAAGSASPVLAAGRPGEAVKHIVLFIGDGMQLEHEIAASRYLYGSDTALSFHKLDYRGNVSTWDVTTYNKYASALRKPAYDPKAIDPTVGYDVCQGGKAPFPIDGPAETTGYFIPALGSPFATDSASAGTALATGYKTDDGNIAWLPGDPANGALKTIAELLREQRDYAVGVVSTVPFSHATPAAMVSHNTSRNNYQAIAAEILTQIKPEVVIGGGYPGAGGTGTFQYLSQDTYDAVKADPEYRVVEREAGVDGALSLLGAAHEAAQEGKKLFGLFGGPGGNFESPEPHDLPGTPLVTRATVENPLLKDAVLAALQVLDRDPDGFFLMAEQGDIDWANHANDYRRMIGTVWDLHEAVQTVVDYIDRPGDDMTWENTLLLVTSDHANSYLRLVDPLGAGDLPTQVGYGSCGYGGSACTYPDGDVTYATTGHTNELVRIYGAGGRTRGLRDMRLLWLGAKGAWYPGTDIIDNTQLFQIMATAAGLPQTSPLKVRLTRPVYCARR